MNDGDAAMCQLPGYFIWRKSIDSHVLNMHRKFMRVLYILRTSPSLAYSEIFFLVTHFVGFPTFTYLSKHEKETNERASECEKTVFACSNEQ